MSGEAQLPNMYATVTLVDRAMRGNCEITYDGAPRVIFKKDEIEKAVPQGIAEWLFQTGKEQVPLRGGGFEMRFGIKDPSAEVLALLGPECANCDPIDIDTERLERWNVEAYVQRGGARKAVQVSRDPSDFQNVAVAGAPTFGLER